MKIPAGLTWRSQPADVAWMKPFKDALRREWVQDLREQLVQHGGQPGTFHMAAPTRPTITAWIVAGWQAVSEETIKHGFDKCGYSHREPADADPSDADDDDTSLDSSTEVVEVLERVTAIHQSDYVDEEMDILDNMF
ncbi:TPA: hypothetical protein N0F65_008141 [Lagenidium giganteum]|uniref:DDE-1 domain-containing protein n=1 Tax=Lagenidium giganteum TaxID=4803 RepID=A0AAV2YFB2_9STRA|nr:TPA: hypothetical protein N0F65_008141 [Lagenidium giganteum]